MNNTLAKILFKIPAVKNFAQKQYQNVINVRAYSAAAATRFTSDWITEQGSINREIKAAHKKLLSRARDLAKNNDYVRGFLKRCVTNIVGPDGFKLQNRAILNNGDPDETSNVEIETKFDEWCRREYCTVHKTLSFIEVQKLLVTQWKRDGNIIARKITGKGVNKFGFALELLEIDLLDTDMHETLRSGNAVMFGIEFNNWKQPVAYYFKSNKASDELTQNYYGFSRDNVKRVPADEIIHYFSKDHANQLLGVTALAQSMLTFHDLQGYDQAAIINARAGASKMGFIQTQQNQLPQAYAGDGEDANGNIISNFSFGEIEQLPAGLEFKGWDPTYPSGEYPSFVKHILRRMATGLGVAYANWVGDLEAVNFSSMRSGLLDERDNWKDDQSQFREGILIPLFDEWLKWAMLSGAVNVSYSQYERVNKPEFIGRRWDWVDPRADVEAKVLQIKNNLICLSDVHAEQGYDFNDYIRRRKKELEQLKEIKMLEAELYPEGKTPQTNNTNNNNNSNGNGKSLLKDFVKVN